MVLESLIDKRILGTKFGNTHNYGIAFLVFSYAKESEIDGCPQFAQWVSSISHQVGSDDNLNGPRFSGGCQLHHARIYPLLIDLSVNLAVTCNRPRLKLIALYLGNAINRNKVQIRTPRKGRKATDEKPAAQWATNSINY